MPFVRLSHYDLVFIHWKNILSQFSFLKVTFYFSFSLIFVVEI